MTIMNSCEINPHSMTREQALLLPDEGKRLYFDRVWLKHPRVKQTLDELNIHTASNSGKSIILLIGPTGVGKSTLIRTLEERFIQSRQQEIERDPGFIPVAMMVAPASGERGFSWKMLYSRLGGALDEPLMDRKLETRLENGRTTVRLPGGTSSVAAMRTAVEKVMAQRHTQLIVIDEAVPILRQATGNSLDNHMDAIKTLADMGTTLVLVGSYDLQKLASLNDQVARRTGLVHFTRYLTGVPQDEEAFHIAVRMLKDRLPIKHMPDLTEYAQDLHVACLGCVGILKGTLSTALGYALNNGGKWSDKFLEQSLLSDELYATILKETIEGEARIKDACVGSSSFKSLRKKSEATLAAVTAATRNCA
jgi:hypothetical protein